MTDKLHSALDEMIYRYKTKLHEQIADRKGEMIEDNVDHYELYELLGVSRKEGQKIDEYQNTGRFLYKYAGALLEEATKLVLEYTKGGKPIRLRNTVSSNPKKFWIDFYVEDDNKAHEIKWRDATTDGDHIRKEHDKVDCIVSEGMIPVKVMFYMPNRDQAIRIQERIVVKYDENGESYVGKDAWRYISVPFQTGQGEKGVGC